MLASNIIRQFLTQFIGLISGFAISIITARILGAAGRGDFSLLLNTSGFLCLLLSFSFGTSVVHIIASNKMAQRSVVNSFLAGTFILIGLCVLLLLVFPFRRFSFLLPSNRAEHPAFYPLILLALFVYSMVSTLFNSVLSGNRRFWEQQKVYLFSTGISIVAYAVLFFIHTRFRAISFSSFFYFYLVIMALPPAGAYYMYMRYSRPERGSSFLSSKQISYIITFSLMAYLCNVFQFLSYRMDFWFVEYFNGSHDLGIYSLAVNLAQMLWLLPQAISTILLSYSGAESPEKGIQNTNTLARIAMLLILSATVFLALTIQFFIPLLYGKEFVKSAYLFKILLAGIVPFSITTILASYFAGTGKIRVNLFCSLIGFLVCLVSDLILIPRYGITGASVATVTAYFTSTAFIAFIYMKQTGTRLSELLLIHKGDIAMLGAKFRQLTVKK